MYKTSGNNLILTRIYHIVVLFVNKFKFKKQFADNTGGGKLAPLGVHLKRKTSKESASFQSWRHECSGNYEI